VQRATAGGQGGVPAPANPSIEVSERDRVLARREGAEKGSSWQGLLHTVSPGGWRRRRRGTGPVGRCAYRPTKRVLETALEVESTHYRHALSPDR
jgi:hypothetical protein